MADDISAGRAALGRVTLVIGGARSGKSAFAESLVGEAGGVYVATSEARDDEMRARIRAHRDRRGPAWRTLEAPLDVAGALAEAEAEARPALLDCLTLWLSNLMEAGRDVEAECAIFVDRLGRLCGPVVLVSNEVGQGIVPENALARRFRDHAGRLNQAVAAEADRVYLVAAGLPLQLK